MNHKLLIIDDDSRNIFALSAVLKARGIECVPATDAKEGIDLLLNDKGIKLVLMDMMLPGMDGYEAIEVIRQNEAISSIPVIAVTARAMTGDEEKCLQAGADAYVSKPVDVDVLMKLLDEHLNQ